MISYFSVNQNKNSLKYSKKNVEQITADKRLIEKRFHVLVEEEIKI